MKHTEQSLWQHMKMLPLPAWFLFLGTFINRFGNFVIIFLILYLTQIGYSAVEAGVVASIFSIGAMLASIIGGELTDRIGRKSTIVISMFASAATMIVFSQVRSLWIIATLTGLAGFAGELHHPASAALLADLTPAGKRVTAFGILRFCSNLGYAIGPVAAGFLADQSSLYLFIGDAATSAAFGLVALIALPNTVATTASEDQPQGTIRAVLSNRSFILVLAASTLVGFIYLQRLSTFALHVRSQGLSNNDYGLLISLNALVVLLIELPITSISQRLPARFMMALGVLLIGVGFGLTTVAHTLPALIVTVLIWTLGEVVFAPVISAYISDIAPTHLQGRYHGTWGFMYTVGASLAPSVGTALFSWNATSLWLICVVLGGVAVVLLLATTEPKVSQERTEEHA
jgi:MFS family permease